MIKAVVNATSFNMLSDPSRVGAGFEVTDILTYEEAAELIKTQTPVAGIGHPDTAGIVARMTGLPLDVINGRPNLSLEAGDTILCFQYEGERLPAGATELPPGSRLTPIVIKVL